MASTVQARERASYGARPGVEHPVPEMPPTGSGSSALPGVLALAAVASMGAGAVHATAAGSHSEHRSALVAFALTAAFQIGWGALALVRSGRGVALLGAAGNAAALGGWVMAKTSGLSFIDGLEAVEDPQFADVLASALAGVAVLGALLAVAAGRRAWVSRSRPALVGVAAFGALALAVPGMVSAAGHAHAGGHADGGHDDMAGHEDGGAAGHTHDAAAALPPEPYTATLPVDLGGVPGVTPEQQAAAEDLVTRTLQDLPQFADVDTAIARGYNSIGDGVTGFEHFVNWTLINDDTVLDPNQPESLVYRVGPGGERTLEAAMFMLQRGVPLDQVPELGGPLTQFHIHNNLCYGGEENAWTVRAVLDPPTPCPPGTQRFEPAPMIHVWIVPQECGPFAALEGVAGGQIAEGEEVLCDHAHGAP